MKRLIAREFTVVDGDIVEERRLNVGETYVYFEDPETGKFYRPADGFMVEAEDTLDLSDRFVEVKGI